MATDFLALLRRVPDDVILAVASREIAPMSDTSCLCGWVIREHFARLRNVAAEDVHPFMTNEECQTAFGGDQSGWDDLYTGVMDKPDDDYSRLPAIEAAYMTRVLECVP